MSKGVNYKQNNPEELGYKTTKDRSNIRHKTLLRSYLFNLRLEYDGVKNLMDSDIKYFQDIEAKELVEDLFIIRKLFQSKYKKNSKK